MKKIISFIAVTILTVFFVGCGICRKVQYVPIQTSKDSIVVEKVVERVDTLKIEIPQEVQVLIAKTDSSHLETSVAVSEAVVDSSGVLHHRLENKKGSLEKEIVYKDKIVEVTVEKEVPVITEVEKKVEVVPEYYKKINIIFWSLVSGLLLGFVIFIMVKFKVF